MRDVLDDGEQTASGQGAFVWRHLGPRPQDIRAMLAELGCSTLDELVARAVPASILPEHPLEFASVGSGQSEASVLEELRELGRRNQLWRSFIGLGYYGTITPPVLQRCILEDPRWYTPYTPYQSEVSQGRLEALMIFQTMVCDLTGMEVSNASLLDDATAAAEAMMLCRALCRGERSVFFVSSGCHPATVAVVQTRARPLGIRVVVGTDDEFDASMEVFGALFQYPDTRGAVRDLTPLIARVHEAGAHAVVAADLLALTLLKPPGEMGADVVVGNTQRFGVPLGYGGPHAGFLATKDAFKRQMPGRIVGLSRDADGRPGYRLALQTREQHIRREKATSNICTAQVLPAVLAAMYAVYHGPEGLRAIALRIHEYARMLAEGLRQGGWQLETDAFFDTVTVAAGAQRASVLERAQERRVNLRANDPGFLSAALDERTTEQDVADLLEIFLGVPVKVRELVPNAAPHVPLPRTSPYLQHPVFHQYHSETAMMRYLNRLANRDISLADSMISLGSCTMKLNPAAAMMPISWPEFAQIHPFVPPEQAAGYHELILRMERMLAEVTGMDAVSLQPNAGSQGEYAGLMAIRSYHAARGEAGRNVCLIPQSAHGTNPASAALAGFRIVVVKCNASGDIDLADLETHAERYGNELAALMVTYPSTHGVFEEGIVRICQIVHEHGGQVYLDGANMNALLGICRPGDLGADVCHLNLHKTFAIPHGGGGPGMGPIAVKAHLAPFLPGHPLAPVGGEQPLGTVSQSPYGSPLILTISYAYMRLMGWRNLKLATQVALLNANYLASRLGAAFPVLYKGRNGFVAHECILDLRRFKAVSVEVEDVAKRLMDYGFHAPTVSFPVPGTLMVEPTESEPKEELDRFVQAMLRIREEIARIEEGNADQADNPLKNAPHPAERVTSNSWTHAYTREEAAYPVAWLRQNKWWPPMGRIDNVYGERHVTCILPPAVQAE
ncbi:MAG: aminomethyl-transferring glycine dehydrogenase [Chthonomonadales bacterium]